MPLRYEPRMGLVAIDERTLREGVVARLDGLVSHKDGDLCVPEHVAGHAAEDELAHA